jgi:ABC-type multidrug transport system permease subunit
MERGMFFREQSSGSYNPISFFLAKIAMDIPLAEACVFTTSTAIYFIFGLSLEEAQQFWIWHYILFMLLLAAIGAAITVGNMFDQIETGINFVTTLWVISMANDGYVVNEENIPSWFGFIRYW